ncbi:MAG: NAD(P)-dependent oxidoreductase [Candidatus Lokiarchaeota archaeon]|nr:NAD(P)-dependent oxidoreductase [Candidatus Lokiarchaeota archaeon]
MSKLVLVDGAKGHTGTFLIKEILETKPDWNIVTTDLPSNKRNELMAKETIFSSRFKYMTEILENKRISFIPADLTDRKSLIHLLQDKQYDIIFHVASLYDYFAELDLLRRINVGGIQNLLDIICKTQDLNILRFIHWSTCGVYGEPKYQKNKKGYPLPGDETAPYNPPNNYSISKMEQEMVLKEYINNYQLKATIIRPAPIMGPYQIYGIFHIMQIVNKSGFGPGIHIYPKKKRLAMPLIHVEDLVRSAIFLAENDESISQAYNLVLDTCFQDNFLEYLADLLNVEYFNFPIWWPFYKLFSKFLFWLDSRKEKKARKLNSRPPVDLSMAGYMNHQYLFSNKKIKDLGFKFKFPDYKSATKDTVEWYLKNKWLESEY